VQSSSWEELERRLRGRGTDSEEAIQRRLETARRELAEAGRYRHRVINDDVERAAQEICHIIRTYEVE
jgi:guanylate kinase